MEAYQLNDIIKQHATLTAALSAHLRTRQAELMEYIDAHLPDMAPAELKVCLVFLLDGRANQTPNEIAAASGIHPNTIREQLYTSKHIDAARNIITRRAARQPVTADTPGGY